MVEHDEGHSSFKVLEMVGKTWDLTSIYLPHHHLYLRLCLYYDHDRISLNHTRNNIPHKMSI
ncbi:hypothetical protein JHK82_035815 [Glycine max]|uniref:Uncharacterized protein n=1 Tax=Glycine max TaxID=3847 RepID=A0A0R0GKV0_SOYBN|nr:hypothetical protein JHK86_035947 [Glycine max]KAG5112546.1 hypothetical protein JHK82_035815 [Glycine max]KAG5129820.1 hypothetical protein JHK84_036217 [Glycine max]KAH1100652.1 hypothetical protein GYH30_035683 [Glycine max]KRH19040.1 hypothetical protein GLYMA_13G097700v4 [Glycine max]